MSGAVFLKRSGCVKWIQNQNITGIRIVKLKKEEGDTLITIIRII